MTTLRMKLCKIDTCWYVIKAISMELNSCTTGTQIRNLDKFPTDLQQAIQDQRQIAWKNFTEGLIARSWTVYMANHYHEVESKRTGQLWTARLSKYLWEAIQFIWNERNDKLHNTMRAQELKGVPLLKEAIKKEMKIGIGSLPSQDFSRYFKADIEKLFNCEEKMIQWFQVVRQGRILMDSRNLQQDEFAESKALQNWIGLSYSVSDEEGIPILIQAIITEMKEGLEGLPREMQQQFDLTVEEIQQQTLDQQKQWFCSIRSKREQLGCASVFDEFSYSGALREWVGLVDTQA